MNCEFCLVVWMGLVLACILFSDGSNASPVFAVCNVHFRLIIGGSHGVYVFMFQPLCFFSRLYDVNCIL